MQCVDCIFAGRPRSSYVAETVAKEADKESGFTPLYSDDLPIKVKIEKITTEIYGGDGSCIHPLRKKQLPA